MSKDKRVRSILSDWEITQDVCSIEVPLPKDGFWLTPVKLKFLTENAKLRKDFFYSNITNAKDVFKLFYDEIEKISVAIENNSGSNCFWIVANPLIAASFQSKDSSIFQCIRNLPQELSNDIILKYEKIIDNPIVYFETIEKYQIFVTRRIIPNQILIGVDNSEKNINNYALITINEIY